MSDTKEKPNKKITWLNYSLTGGVILLTFIVMTYLVAWYADQKKAANNTTLAASIFSQINSNELDNYLIENPNAFVYLASSKNNNLGFEQEIQTLVNQYYLKEYFVYLDLANLDEATFFNHAYQKLFSEKLQQEVELFAGYTNIIYIVDGKVDDLLYKTEQEPNIQDVKRFLIAKGIIVDNA